MGKLHEGIDERLRAWLLAQPVFFVATAPLAADGHVNLSPRGVRDTFAVVDERTVAWLDLTGSGAETIAHLRENGRVVVMFCAFDGSPDVVRLHGRGRPVFPGAAGWAELSALFPAWRSARGVIVVDVERVSSSCGFGVPLMEYAGDRTLMREWADRRSDEQIAEYQNRRNAVSIDGLPALPVVPKPETAVSASETRPGAG